MLSILVLLLTVLALSAIVVQMYYEREQLRRAVRKYDALVSQEGFQERLNSDIRLKKRELVRLSEEQESLQKRFDKSLSQAELEEWLDSNISLKQEELTELKSEQDRLSARVVDLRQQVYELQEEEYVQSFGFYQPRYEFISAGNYDSQLKRIKPEQRRMVLDDEAAICRISLILKRTEGESSKKSEEEGQKMVNNFLKLVLTIFNSECDDFISKVKHSSNVEQVEEKIRKLYSKLNKVSEVINCEITVKYLRLKSQQLHLQYQVECEKQEEREREQIIREERQERQKLEKIMKTAEEAEERENQYRQELENAVREKDLVMGMEKEKLELEIQQLRQNLAKATSDKEKANSQAAMTKAGYIYVVSNIGSFGRDVYRICMTKKGGDPDDYINAMNPVVPFPFDIHLKFVSEDALDTLARLQQRFSDRRVNKFRNERKGFFRVSLDEIIQVVEEIKQDTGALKNIYPVKVVQPYEYYKTQSIERKEKQILNSVNIDLDNETA